MSATIQVVAGVILDSRRERVLLARRALHQHQGGLWEYPGGKCDSGESLTDALARELLEELGIDVVESSALLDVRHAYPDKTVHLHFQVVTAFTGEPEGREGQHVQWIEIDALSEMAFPAANTGVADALRVWLHDRLR